MIDRASGAGPGASRDDGGPSDSGELPRFRLQPQIDGGGQEGGLRSGTLNVPGIVGLAAALELCVGEMASEGERLRGLRDRLFRGLCGQLEGVSLNGPALERVAWRLPGNLNVSIAGIDGEALLVSLREIAVSSGAACSAANPEPSHVLRALGRSDEAARASLRFGLGRYNTEADVDVAVRAVTEAVRRLRSAP